MADILENAPVRLPDHASVEAALARFPAGADEAALTAAFPGFVFSAANDDDEYWRVERSVLAADGTRIAEYRPWMEAELAKNNGDVEAVWSRLRETDLQISEWHGNSVYAFAPTGSGAADYVQTSLGREIEWRAGPIVNPSYRPWSELDLLDSSWIDHDARSDDKVIAGLALPFEQACRQQCRACPDIPHAVRAPRARQARGARRPEMEQRVWIGSDGTQRPFLELQPDWFDVVPREVRFFQDWEESSAHSARVFEHWALDITDYEHNGQREIGFITRPLHLPKESLKAGDASVHMLMDRIEAIDREVGLAFGWYFLIDAWQPSRSGCWRSDRAGPARRARAPA